MEAKKENTTVAKSGFLKGRVKKSHLLPILSLLVVPLAVVSTYVYLRQRPDVLGVNINGNTPSPNQAEESLLVVARLSKIMQLPDEQPTVATVTDTEKLTSQPFFKSAKNGDKVVIFAQAKRAILYRDEENKIIEVGVVNSQGAPQSEASVKEDNKVVVATPIPNQFRVAYFNGSGEVGAGRRVEDLLKTAVPEARTTARAIANKTDYEGNFVIDLGGTRESDASRIASAISASLVTLPDGEKRPDDADFLVIIGKSVTE
jgi:hypothetical protein